MRDALAPATLRRIYHRVAGRYDWQHALLTANADQRGRRLVVEHTVQPGDRVLDAGGGTGSTALLAAERSGPSGSVTPIDFSKAMLNVAKQRAATAKLTERMTFTTADILDLPFPDKHFDAVLSTYSICPLYDPTKGALELYRVLKPGGLLGTAHSTEPNHPFTRWLADKVETLAWHFPSLSLGCRAVNVLPTLQQAGAQIIFKRKIGVPLWPFLVFSLQKPQEP